LIVRMAFAQLLIFKTHAVVRSGSRLVVLIRLHVREWKVGVLKNVNQVIMLFVTEIFASKKKAASASTT